MALSTEKIVEQIIFPALEEYQDSIHGKFSKSLDLKLFGSQGALESIAFVGFLLAVEELANSISGRSIRLMDQRALMQAKSPFTTVQSLAEYIEKKNR